jgi:hypothetical protein
MNRRVFLKKAIVAALAGCAAAVIPIKTVSARDEVLTSFGLLRGTSEGQILLSQDGGLNWQTAHNFGSQFKVQRIYQQGESVYAELVFGGEMFMLKSQDAKTWKTLDYVSPKHF